MDGPFELDFVDSHPEYLATYYLKIKTNSRQFQFWLQVISTELTVGAAPLELWNRLDGGVVWIDLNISRMSKFLNLRFEVVEVETFNVGDSEKFDRFAQFYCSYSLMN